MGSLERKWGPKTEKGPHGDPGPQMGTHLGVMGLEGSKSITISKGSIHEKKAELYETFSHVFQNQNF